VCQARSLAANHRAGHRASRRVNRVVRQARNLAASHRADHRVSHRVNRAVSRRRSLLDSRRFSRFQLLLFPQVPDPPYYQLPNQPARHPCIHQANLLVFLLRSPQTNQVNNPQHNLPNNQPAVPRLSQLVNLPAVLHRSRPFNQLLSQVGSPSQIPQLNQLLNHQDNQVVSLALFQLSNHPDSQVANPLVNQLEFQLVSQHFSRPLLQRQKRLVLQ
jgi:hypothetical protein